MSPNFKVDKYTLKNLPISLKILLAFLIVCCSLTFVSGTFYYRHSRSIVVEAVTHQASLLCEYIENEFRTDYAEPIERALVLVTTSPQLDNFLMSSKEEKPIYRAEVEKLFLSLSQQDHIGLSVSFLNQSGQEEIALHEGKRQRIYRSLAEISNDGALGQNMARLFTELEKGKANTFAYSAHFYDAQNRPGFLVGIRKQEPEAGGFGGVIIKHCDLRNFIRDLSQSKILGANVMWLYGNKWETFLSQNNRIDPDPKPFLTSGKQSANCYIYTADCKLFAGENPLMTAVCSVPKRIISKELTPVIWTVTAIFSVLFVVSLISSFLISHWISKPIKRLTKAIQGISGKNLDLNLSSRLTDAKDEVGILATAFKRMTDDLKQSTTSIDNLKKTEDELRKAKEHAEEANRAKSQFIANTSHEIRTPMNSILGFAELLGQEQLTPEQHNYVDTIYHSGEHLLGIINDILNLSKIEAGRLEMHSDDTSTDELTESTFSTVRLMAQQKGLLLTKEIDAGVPAVFHTDKDKLRQVLINLLGNAMKFTSKGSVKLIAKKLEANGEQAENSGSTDAIWFCVEDSGPGIADKDKQRVFEAFTQLDSTDKRGQSGTGLGLTISAKLVQMLGGELKLESEVGKGSKFFFSIPYIQPPKIVQPISQPEIQTNEEAMNKNTILVVEDDEPCLRLFKEYLRKNGYEVIGLDRGGQAVDLVTALKPAAVVLDINLPDANGFEILRQLKANPVTSAIPVIICSIMAEKEMSINLGAMEHLTKPVDSRQFIETLRRALKRKTIATILAVDDEPAVLEMYKAALNNPAYVLHTATSGQQALEYVQQLPHVDLMLVDLCMPQMDGFELITAVRQRYVKSLPIMVITSKELTPDEYENLKAATRRICEKSRLTPQQLVEQVNAELAAVIPQPSRTCAVQAAGPAATTGTASVLIVDDVAENRMLLEIMIKKAGYTVSSCENGKQACDITDNQKFDLILMDIQMPVMDGLEATKYIKSNEVNKHTPVIALTARAMKGDNVMCVSAGCDDYICKPVKYEDLLAKLAKNLRQQKSIETAASGGELISDLAGNPDYTKAVEMFVNNLPGRIKDMADAFEQGNLQDLSQKAHALKGLGGFAGFPIYTEKAKELEEMVRSNKLEDVRRQLDELSELCHRTKTSSTENK